MLVRLDREIVKRGFAETRSRAQFLIRSGGILVNDKLITKTSYRVCKNDQVKLIRNVNRWVSRSGLKLEHAIKVFNLEPLDGIALDIGASTGGFTEVLLFYGCKKVYAVDVGKNQLNKKLKRDDRVVSLEQTNAKNLDNLGIPLLDYIVCDASFISIEKVLKHSLKYAKSNCQLIALIKPQFEVGVSALGKRGIVRKSKFHYKACESVRTFLEKVGWLVENLEESPITGSNGNVEFLISASNNN